MPFYTPSWDRKNQYYPVTGPDGTMVHLMWFYRPQPSKGFTETFTLCGRLAREGLPGTVEDATCQVCKVKAKGGATR